MVNQSLLTFAMLLAVATTEAQPALHCYADVGLDSHSELKNTCIVKSKGPIEYNSFDCNVQDHVCMSLKYTNDKNETFKTGLGCLYDNYAVKKLACLTWETYFMHSNPSCSFCEGDLCNTDCGPFSGDHRLQPCALVPLLVFVLAAVTTIAHSAY